MTLREEIFEIIRQRYFPSEYLLVSNNVDEILKLFEKLIDEKIRNVQSTYKSSQDTFLQHEKRSSIIKILEELKEELKK